MKIAVVVACLVAVAAARSLDERQAMFGAFIKEHDRKYSPGEFDFRFEVFSKNLAVADKLNAQDAHASYGVTQFSDLTEEEFTTRYANLRFDGPTHPVENNLPTSGPLKDVDHRSKLNGVKNQGACGSCWAFSVIAGIEGNLRISGKDPKADLSEQQLLDCDNYDGACNGGLMHYAYKYYKDVSGRVDVGDYSYEARKNTCKDQDYDQGASVSSYNLHCDAFTQGTAKCDEDSMAKALQSSVLDVAVDASGAFQNYRGGIITSGCGTRLNHAVNAVGYGTDGETNTAYYIIRNSWGSTWGEKGYARLEHGAGRCGVNMYVGQPNF